MADSNFSSLLGTLKDFFKISINGPMWKVVSALKIQARNVEDTSYVPVEVADPVDPNDAVTKQYYDSGISILLSTLQPEDPTSQFSYPMSLIGLLSDAALPVAGIGLELITHEQTILKFIAMRSVAGVSGTTTIDLELNGVVVPLSTITFTSADAAFLLKSATISLPVVTGDRISVKLSTAEASAENLYMAASIN